MIHSWSFHTTPVAINPCPNCPGLQWGRANRSAPYDGIQESTTVGVRSPFTLRGAISAGCRHGINVHISTISAMEHKNWTSRGGLQAITFRHTEDNSIKILAVNYKYYKNDNSFAGFRPCCRVHPIPSLYWPNPTFPFHRGLVLNRWRYRFWWSVAWSTLECMSMNADSEDSLWMDGWPKNQVPWSIPNPQPDTSAITNTTSRAIETTVIPFQKPIPHVMSVINPSIPSSKWIKPMCAPCSGPWVFLVYASLWCRVSSKESDA